MYWFTRIHIRSTFLIVLALAGAGWIYADTHYVNKANVAGAASPYTSWATAATNIQDAVDQAAADDTVFVTNGVYDTGGRALAGFALTNRVVVETRITLRAVSTNPADTVIVGAPDPGTGTNGPSAIRCININANGGLFTGFTLTNGHTAIAGDARDLMGGGILFGYFNSWGTVSNCVIIDCTTDCTGNWGGGGFSGGNDVTNYNCWFIGNVSGQNGGASYRGIFVNCVVSNNACALGGGGFYLSKAFDCTIVNNRANINGGGVYSCPLVDRCIVRDNYAGSVGGGAWCSTGVARNSLFTGNTAAGQGGGFYACQQILNCTIVSNYAPVGGGVRATCALTNCVIFYNTPNNLGPVGQTYNMSYTCVPTNELTTSVIVGSGNITNNPLFVDSTNGNYRLMRLSPCVNMGLNQDWMAGVMDLDGHARIITDVVDMGAYEYDPPPPGTIITVW